MFLPSTMEASILQFASCFTQPSFQTYGVIVTGWLLARGMMNKRHLVHAVVRLSVTKNRYVKCYYELLLAFANAVKSSLPFAKPL